MTEKHQCSKVVDYSFGHPLHCQKNAIVERDGKWYCKIHDPEYVKAKDAARQAKWDAESKARNERWGLELAQRAALAGLSLEEVKALTPALAKAAPEMYVALRDLAVYVEQKECAKGIQLDNAFKALAKVEECKQ